MRDLFQETFVGQIIYHASRHHLLPYPEESSDNDYLREKAVQRNDFSQASTLATSPAEETVLVSWNGPDDPANPQCWSVGKKIFVTALICLLTFSIYIGSAIYTASYQGIAEAFGASQVVVTLGLSLYVLGYATGPMLFAPIAETPLFGRTMVYLPTLLAFILLNFGCVYATNIGMLLAFRFLTGFVGSPVLATGGASLADLWSPAKRAYAIGIWGLFAVCGPTLGPLAGGFAVQAKGWTWAIWELIWLNTFCFVVLIFTLPETSPQNILFRKAYRLRKRTGSKAFQSQAELDMASFPLSAIVRESLWRPFQLCFTEVILLSTNVYLGLIYAILYTWFEAFPLVFGEIYHFGLGVNGVAFLGLFVGAVLAMIPYVWWLWKYQEPQFDADGNIAPEKRLPPAIVGSFFLPACLFMFGWTSRESVHWIVPIIASALFPIGAVLLFNALLLYQGDAYPKYVGSVLAGNDLMRGAFGAGFPLFATAMFRKLSLGWGCSLLGFISVAFIPIPFLFWKYGERLRKASKNARHDI